MSLDLKGRVVTVRPEESIATKQNLPYYVGISQETAGAKGLSMNMVVIPPGGSPKAHFHKDFETAIYLLKGRVETRFGENLKESIINEEGDFVYIPPGVPHKPVNLSETETALAIVSRNDPNEHENVVAYEEE
ncbi:MAG: cupin domain-containing protein [Nitrospinae bacterium]|nr:cupin domain-containing protein [Nitrospinota bacterium]MZH05732.1 cupin domain-containing protein [Nitrospinota bacterium]MZH15088.1 cupin domain-containing protein [Nitrospinota bacterium]